MAVLRDCHGTPLYQLDRRIHITRTRGLAGAEAADLPPAPGAGRASGPDPRTGGLTMPPAEVEAWEVACTAATAADGTVDEARRFPVDKSEYERRIAERR